MAARWRRARSAAVLSCRWQRPAGQPVRKSVHLGALPWCLHRGPGGNGGAQAASRRGGRWVGCRRRPARQCMAAVVGAWLQPGLPPAEAVGPCHPLAASPRSDRRRTHARKHHPGACTPTHAHSTQDRPPCNPPQGTRATHRRHALASQSVTACSARAWSARRHLHRRRWAPPGCVRSGPPAWLAAGIALAQRTQQGSSAAA